VDDLTPTARLTYEAIRNGGPGNVHELRDRTGRSRSATDKAINDLAKANLIVKVDDGGDPADGAPTRWRLADPASAGDEATGPETTEIDGATEPDTTDTVEADPGTPDEATDGAPAADAPNPAMDQQPADDGPASDDAITDSSATLDGPTDQDGEAQPDGEAELRGDAEPDGEGEQAEAEPPKLCRGCQAQMPKICECCWQKTPAYCGKCRRSMPQVRRGEPGEPVILSNGLTKLRPGELEAMVEKVMREHPLPAFAGIVGWTGGRLAIHLPGRSPGAITNAMRKFANAGKAELIGDDPERYKLTDAEQPDGDTGGGEDEESPTEAAQPAADATTEPQPDNAA